MRVSDMVHRHGDAEARKEAVSTLRSVRRHMLKEICDPRHDDLCTELGCIHAIQSICRLQTKRCVTLRDVYWARNPQTQHGMRLGRCGQQWLHSWTFAVSRWRQVNLVYGQI